MNRKYSEQDITWSSIECQYQYKETIWSKDKYGIPIYKLYDDSHEIIDVSNL